MKSYFCILLCIVMFAMIGCAGKKDDIKKENVQTTQTEESGQEIEEEMEVQKPDDDLKTTLGLQVRLADLSEDMQPMFRNNRMINETVMFLDKGETKALLYPIEKIESVTSYGGTTVYEEGKDFEVVDGKLRITENSSITCITSRTYYHASDAMLRTMFEDEEMFTYWGEGQPMTKWQLSVTYTHADTWAGYSQRCEGMTYQNFIKKLQNGEDVTVFFYGDSITYGANSSWYCDYLPYRMPYSILFVQALADLFDYTVRYEKVNLTAPNNGMATPPVPSEDYVAGNRGIITYVNTSIGGWASTNGADDREEFVNTQVKKYGCDLFVIGFGMNDGSHLPTQVATCLKYVIDDVIEWKPEASIVVISTMLPNPNATNGWYGYQEQQESQLQLMAQDYREKGVACGVCCMTSVSQSILEQKEFHDYSGNNINHPNDWFMRVYAQTLLHNVIGYNNMEEM